MIRDVSRFTKSKFDLLVIGGGINGAAIAHLASACGASVALLEKGDFASGTSSKSTKLLHGGIRYLEHLEFDLVYESLKERYIQLQAAPFLVKPMPFVIPVYKGDARPLWMMKLGVWLYDLLSGKYRIGQHRYLSAQDIMALAPGIKTEGLLGGVEYFDAQMDDARLCLENVLMADNLGATTANYMEVEGFIKDKNQAIAVKVRDILSGNVLDIYANKIIVAAGPWSDDLMQKDVPKSIRRLRPTKGVHIVYQGQISSNAFLLQNHKDKRVFFMIPFKGNSLIGTTDTDCQQSPDKLDVEERDVQYLLQEASRIFPDINFDPAKIITTFAGLRPLVADSGAPSRLSRKHAIVRSWSGIYYVMGGKYTTYRAIAEDVLSRAMPHLISKMPYAGQYALYGSGGVNEELKILSQRFDVALELVRYLQGIYGSRFIDVLNITRQDHRMKEQICSCSPAIGAQVVYSARIEMAQSVEDIVSRRLGLSYVDCPTGHCRLKIAEILKNHP